MKRFEDKTVVITGGSRGIGAAIARRFAREGANLVVSANEELVHGVAEQIRAEGGKAISFIGDVTDKASVKALYDAAEKEFGAEFMDRKRKAAKRSRKIKPIGHAQQSDEPGTQPPAG